jgi:hypothetical protein
MPPTDLNADVTINTLPGTPAFGLPSEGQDIPSTVLNNMFSSTPPAGSNQNPEPDEDGDYNQTVVPGPSLDVVDPLSMNQHVVPPAISSDPFDDVPQDRAASMLPGDNGKGITLTPQSEGGAQPVDPIKLAMEFQRLKTENENLAVSAPLLRFLQKRPDIMQTVIQAIESEGKPAQAPAPQAPVAPVRPAMYNETEAYTVPESESWKFRKEMEGYQEAKVNYLEQQMAVREAEVRRQMEVQQERSRAEMLQQQAIQDAMRAGLRTDEVSDYMKVMNHPLSASPENLVKYYRLLRNQNPRGQARRAQSTPPLPGGGGNPPQSGNVDQFQGAFSGMLASWKNPR